MARSREERIDRFVTSVERRLEATDEPFSKLRVILDECGWSKIGSRNLAQISVALAERGIFTWPRLTTRLGRETQVRFRREPWEARPVFPNEDDFRDFLVANFDRIPDFSDLKDPRPEFPLRSGRHVDILARGRADDAYVVIELKTEYRKVVDQMTFYLTEVARRHAGGRPVRGIVITGQPVPELAVAHSEIAGFRVDWCTYRVHLTLEE